MILYCLWIPANVPQRLPHCYTTTFGLCRYQRIPKRTSDPLFVFLSHRFSSSGCPSMRLHTSWIDEERKLLPLLRRRQMHINIHTSFHMDTVVANSITVDGGWEGVVGRISSISSVPSTPEVNLFIKDLLDQCPWEWDPCHLDSQCILVCMVDCRRRRHQ